jgi:lipoate-protein ligase A
VHSAEVDPWFNLALEQTLCSGMDESGCLLYLWQNADTVVIGSNQNPWKECDLGLMEADGVKLARRSSGGGAVFHDLGNLNFTFVMGNRIYDEQRQTAMILEAVRSFGLDATMSGRNDLLADGRKFSGNAYFYGDTVSYQHGTLLVDCDLAKLGRYLTPSKAKIESKGIDSVSARVVNLASLDSAVTVDALKERLVQAFRSEYGVTGPARTVSLDNADAKMLELVHRNASWQWRYGQSPSFSVRFEDRFPWGEIAVGLELEDGIIRKVSVVTDSLVPSIVPTLERALGGIRYDGAAIAHALLAVSPARNESPLLDDILQLFRRNLQ